MPEMEKMKIQLPEIIEAKERYGLYKIKDNDGNYIAETTKEINKSCDERDYLKLLDLPKPVELYCSADKKKEKVVHFYNKEDMEKAKLFYGLKGEKYIKVTFNYKLVKEIVGVLKKLYDCEETDFKFRSPPINELANMFIYKNCRESYKDNDEKYLCVAVLAPFAEDCVPDEMFGEKVRKDNIGQDWIVKNKVKGKAGKTQDTATKE